MSETLLRVTGLKTHFATRAGLLKAVHGVSFSVGRGEILGLVGESGSGKTVTGFSLLGLVEPPGRIVAGEILFEGENLVGMSQKDLRKRRGARLAMIFQDPMMTLNPVLKIGEQMRLAFEAHDNSGEKAFRARAVDVLTRVGIPDAAARLDAYPHQFSGGMRQRVAIAMALLHRPSLIVADEPTTALDVSIQAQILTEVRALARDTGTALIWITHDLATVAALADTIAVMYAGKLVETGAVRDVLAHPYHPYTSGLLASRPSRAKPGEKLTQIPGSMPSLLALPQGCAFAPRCARALPRCASDDPAFTERGARRFRCHNPLEASP